MLKKKVIIIGTGVLGSYLSKFFLSNKDKVFVTTRYLRPVYKNYKYQKIEKKVKFIKLNVLNKKDIYKILIKIKPDLIYYFAGQSSIFISYQKPLQTMNSNFYGALNFLKILKEKNLDIKFFKASSGYIFEKLNYKNETKTKYVKPNNPYIKSQIEAHRAVSRFRNLGLNCSSLIFFNIESPLKSEHFLLNKVKNFVKFRKKKFLKLGNINSIRDFSWAPEIMKGVYYSSFLKSQDIIFGSGKNFSIKEMVKYFFEFKNIDFEKYVRINKSLFRKNEKQNLITIKINSNKLLKKRKWIAKVYGKKLVKKLYKL